MVSEKDLQSYLKVAASALPCREARKEFSSYVHLHPIGRILSFPNNICRVLRGERQRLQ